MKVSKKEMVSLKNSREDKVNHEIEERSQRIEARCADGFKNYEKLKHIFPWLDEENGSYL
jgi:hypothetical protein